MGGVAAIMGRVAAIEEAAPPFEGAITGATPLEGSLVEMEGAAAPFEEED